MPKPNTRFDLSLEDLDLIETALQSSQKSAADSEARKMQELLGRLHNQKVFFRPKGVYVSG